MIAVTYGFTMLVMRSLLALFRPVTVVKVQLNARIMPLDRGARYEDPLMDALREHAIDSEVIGGGTMMEPTREPKWCDIEIELKGNSARGRRLIVETLEKLGAPKGSVLRTKAAEPVFFGVSEGVGLYLNGTDLPEEVYSANDLGDLIAELEQALGEAGELHSRWQGAAETALYFYGPSAQRLIERIESVTATHPLAQRCRIVELTGLPG